MSDETGRAVERLAETTSDPGENILDRMFALGEQNTRVAQEVVIGHIRGLRRHAEDNLTMMEESVERVERQRDVFQKLAAEYFGACASLYFSPLSYRVEGQKRLAYREQSKPKVVQIRPQKRETDGSRVSAQADVRHRKKT